MKEIMRVVHVVVVDQKTEKKIKGLTKLWSRPVLEKRVPRLYGYARIRSDISGKTMHTMETKK